MNNFNSIKINVIHYQKPFPKENSKPRGFHWILQKFKEEIKSILHNLFQKIEEEKILPNSKCYEASITLLSKSDKNITRHYIRRKLHTNIPHWHRYKILHKISILTNWIHQYKDKNIQGPSVVHPRNAMFV